MRPRSVGSSQKCGRTWQAPHSGEYVAYAQFDSVARTPVGGEDPVLGGDSLDLASATSPIDPEDVLKITSTTQAPAGEVTFTWPSKAGVSYGVRFGGISSWTVIGNSLAGTGIEMSFTDDGSLTGGLPSAGSERHCQVIVE
jgi:hypothetical protein